MEPSGESMRAGLALIGNEPVDDAGRGMDARLTRLCRAAKRALPATGVGVSLMTVAAVPALSVASSAASELVEELQFTLGEGPCRDAYTGGRPVLVDDLSTQQRRWPGYTPAARGHGVEAVFAFPLGVGTVSLGTMDVFRDHRGDLAPRALVQALTFAEVALRTVLDGVQQDGAERAVDDFDGAVTNRLELYQAQGMLIAQLEVGPEEAMARLRAYAFAHDRRLSEVAHAIVTRRLTLSPEGS